MLKFKPNAYIFPSFEPFCMSHFPIIHFIPGRSRNTWPELSILAIKFVLCTSRLFIKCFVLSSVLHILLSLILCSSVPKMLAMTPKLIFKFVCLFVYLGYGSFRYLVSFGDCLMQCHSLCSTPNCLCSFFGWAEYVVQPLLFVSLRPRGAGGSEGGVRGPSLSWPIWGTIAVSVPLLAEA